MPEIWENIARENQKIPEGDWSLWMILAGRGFGKTRTGAESVSQLVYSGEYKRVAIIGKNLKETRDIMIEGVSGILSTTYFTNYKTSNKSEKFLKYYPAKRQVQFSNGALAYILGADNYDSLRGLQFDLVWIDEFAKFKNPRDSFDQIMFTLRSGKNPRCIMTTTPKPLPVLKELAEKSTTYLTKGTTFDNSPNLSAKFIETMKATYVNTRLGDQELFGEIILDQQNAVWRKEDIIYQHMTKEDMETIVIGVDPAVSCSETSDETGIIVVGMGINNNIYVMDDLSGKYAPQEWVKIICRAYKDYAASKVIAETNNGGDLVREMLMTIYPYIPFVATKAIKGKIARAEPIALLYNAKKIFHVKRFKQLEEQMCSLSYDEKLKSSPDRVDALVWAVNALKCRNECCVSFV